MSETSRRIFLGSAVGAGGLLLPWRGSGALALADPSAAADRPSPTLTAMRQLLRDFRAAENYAMSFEDRRDCDELPVYVEARTREEALAAEFDRLWAQPVTCWDDVVARAEAAAFWNRSLDAADDRIEGVRSETFDERSLAHLVEAVLELARR
jgi:hypothetical protein